MLYISSGYLESDRTYKQPISRTPNWMWHHQKPHPQAKKIFDKQPRLSFGKIILRVSTFTKQHLVNNLDRKWSPSKSLYQQA